MRCLLWGTGKVAERYVKSGMFAGHKIVAFVDTFKRADSFFDCPVLSVDEVSQLDFDVCVVCVAKNNDEILQLCVDKNFDLSKFFFPFACDGFGNVPIQYANLLIQAGSIKTDFPVLYQNVLELQMAKKYISDNAEIFSDTALIRKIGQEYVVAWIPVELLFSERTDDYVSRTNFKTATKEWRLFHSQYSDIPLVGFEPHRTLFSFFRNGDAYPRKYLDWYQSVFVTQGLAVPLSDVEILKKRFREFRIMQSELNKGMQFFVDLPAKATWNERGYFNLWDGHHRSMFLYVSGCSKIPVQISTLDYEKWSNQDSAIKLKELVASQKRVEFYQPIPNPYFLNLNTNRDNFCKSRLHHLMEYFNATKFAGKRVVDIGANIGYFGSHFARLGADVTMVEPDLAHFELAKQARDLLHIKCQIVNQKFEVYEDFQHFDMAILLTVLYHYLSNEQIKRLFFEKLNEMVDEMIVWESGDDPDYEKTQIIENTKFKNYTHLAYTYATRRFRELGLFSV